MPSITHIDCAQITKRLRWLMIGMILFDVVITFISQPATYWQHPETAFESNLLFHFFLGTGVLGCILLYLAYMGAAFTLVSILPGRIGLVSVFSIIICHFFRASCWLEYRWQFGMTTTLLYGFLLGEFFVSMAFPVTGKSIAHAVKRLRWVMLGTMIFDTANTVLGQPASYWHNPETANEGFPLSRFFLVRGLVPYFLYDVIFFSLLFSLVSFLPKRWALVIAFLLILSYYFGACTWINNSWHFGADGPIIYGIILSAIIVLLAFPPSDKAHSELV